MWVLLNGVLVPEDEARVSVFDRGFTYGDGLFETLRAYEGTCFRLEAHLDRLFGAAGTLRLPAPRTRAGVVEDIRAVLERNGLRDAVVRMQLTRGPGGRGPRPPEPASPTWVVAAWPLPGDLDDRYRKGAGIVTVGIRKPHPATLPASAKHSNYLNSVLAVAEASACRADEGVLLTTDGFLAECAAANLFFVVGGRLLTPSLDLGILPGVTRALVLDLAQEAGLPFEEGDYVADRLEGAAEVFLTNSTLGLWPVGLADGRLLPFPGPLTATLMRAYRERVRSETAGDHFSPALS